MSFVTVTTDTCKIHREILKELDQVEQILHSGRPCLVVDADERKNVNWSPEILGFRSGSGLTHIVRRILLDACQKAENIGAGSAELVLAWATALAREIIQENLSTNDATTTLNQLQNKAESFLNEAQVVAKQLKENEFQKVLELLCNNPKAASMVWEAIQLGGMEGRIFVDTKTSDHSLVEVVCGNVFDLAPHPEILDVQEKWDERLVRVAIIDGFVERVSEIHNLLEPASKDSQPMIIFARDFDNEIITTLSVNRARGTLNVIPVKVTFDENNANSLKDLSVVTGGFVVSALTGDLISTQKFEELPVVDRVSLDRGKLIIYNEKVTSDISVLIGELQQRRKDTGHEAMQALLDKRLRSLTSLSVRIKCEHTMASLIPEIDLLLRTSRAIVRNGVVNLHEWRVPDVFASSHQEAINVSKIPETTPVLTALATIKQGTQAAAELLSINAALTVD
ncbi:MAG: hypothetical protein ACW96N_01535 [Candidatus Thorarchaeota archaeon]|jgi:chaperonin GroEL